MADKELDANKRRFLIAATSVAGGVAAGATAVPFVASMMPSERAKAAGERPLARTLITARSSATNVPTSDPFSCLPVEVVTVNVFASPTT